ncbi:MAG: polyhydroxyalkanoate synthesis repressor PhaR [Novosphingobium sp.]
MTKDRTLKEGEPIVIKKYANRRLYNTHSSSYITLDHLAKMIREEVEFQVIDAKSGTDITHTILTQIIMDEESTGEQMLPTSFLRQLIGMYGNSIQSLVPGFLEASMDQFRANQAKLRKTFEGSIGSNPMAQLAQRNMDMFKAAASAFRSGKRGGEVENKGGEDPPAADTAVSDHDEIVALRAEMAEMQKKLDALIK